MQVTLLTVLLFFLIITINCLEKQKDCKCRILQKPKIIGGKDAHHLAYPWIVSLSHKKDETIASLRKFVDEKEKINFHSCAGTIINEYWILTAAHCIPTKTDKLYIGYGNDNDLVKIFDFGRIESMSLITYPRYPIGVPTLKIKYDIALIQLKEPIKFTNYIKPACFLNKNEELYTGYLDHAGWGSTKIFKTNFGKKETFNLQMNRNLKEMYLIDKGGDYKDCYIEKNIICANGFKKDESSCKGDSGGPIHYTTNGKSYVVGLTSYGIDSYWKNSYKHFCVGTTAYTRVSSYLDWVKEYVGDDICEF